MGYERKKVFRLTFEDEQYEGLEIQVRTTSMKGFLDMSKLAALDKRDLSADDIEELDPLFQRFAECLVSWNLEEDGDPVPMTKEAFLDQDADFVMDVIGAWLDAATGVSGTLGKQSTSGGPSLVESIPMETLSPSLAS